MGCRKPNASCPLLSIHTTRSLKPPCPVRSEEKLSSAPPVRVVVRNHTVCVNLTGDDVGRAAAIYPAPSTVTAGSFSIAPVVPWVRVPMYVPVRPRPLLSAATRPPSLSRQYVVGRVLRTAAG